MTKAVPVRSRASWTAEEHETAVRVFTETRSFEAAAAAVGRTKVAVKIRLRRNGITHRAVHGGYQHSEATKDRIRRNREMPRGENHPNWRGGRRVSWAGYYEVLMPDHHRARKNGYVFEHILVAEKTLGRKLRPGEVVHHKDHNKLNNHPENLEVLSASEHAKKHARPRTGEYRECPVCKQPFYVKRSHREIRKTCSFRCAGVLFRGYYTGKPIDYRPTQQEKLEVAQR